MYLGKLSFFFAGKMRDFGAFIYAIVGDLLMSSGIFEDLNTLIWDLVPWFSPLIHRESKLSHISRHWCGTRFQKKKNLKIWFFF